MIVVVLKLSTLTMASLSKSNKHLRDAKTLREIVTENCVATAAFEGARVRVEGHVSPKRRDMHSSKKSARSS